MIIIRKEGDVTPMVAAADPQNPPTLYPTKVAAFMAMGPGVICEMAIISRNWSTESQWWMSIISFLMRGIIA